MWPFKFRHLKWRFWDGVPMGHKNKQIFSQLYICLLLWPIGTEAHYRQIVWRNLNDHAFFQVELFLGAVHILRNARGGEGGLVWRYHLLHRRDGGSGQAFCNSCWLAISTNGWPPLYGHPVDNVMDFWSIKLQTPDCMVEDRLFGSIPMYILSRATSLGLQVMATDPCPDCSAYANYLMT